MQPADYLASCLGQTYGKPPERTGRDDQGGEGDEGICGGWVWVVLGFMGLPSRSPVMAGSIARLMRGTLTRMTGARVHLAAPQPRRSRPPM